MSAVEKTKARKIERRTSTVRKPYRFVGSGLMNVYLVGVEYEVDIDTKEQRADIPRLPDLLTQTAVALLGKEAPLTGEELRFLRKRVGKASKDFARHMEMTSEQYSRIENGRKLTGANDKLARLLVMLLSVEAALKKPELMERIADKTWSAAVGPDWRIIARVDADRHWKVETAAA